MPSKLLFVTLLLLASCLALPSFPLSFSTHVSVGPPSTYPGELLNSGNGSDINISALPGEWKEPQQAAQYSNRLLVQNSNDCYWQVGIRLKDTTPDLTDPSTGKKLPGSALKWIFTYVGGAYAGGSAADAIGTRLVPVAYSDFSTSWTYIYNSGLPTIEAPSTFSDHQNREFQFKYAVKVPDNQPPGAYEGYIEYIANETSNSPMETNIIRNAKIIVTILPYFRLSVDRGTIDFDKMSPGQTKDNIPVEGVIVTSKSNTGNPWYLKISNDNPLSNGPYMIPNSNFIWYGWTDGSGRWYGNGTDQMSLTPMLAYSSGVIEGNNLPNGTNNHLKFKLTIPKGQSGGKYITTVRLTMTE
jgi:hypothetical protein